MQPRRRTYLNTLVEEFLAALTRRGRGNEETEKSYRRELWRMLHGLDVAELATTPSKIGEGEIDYVINEMYGHCKPKTQQWYVAIFSGWLKFHGNRTVEKMMISWPADNRMSVDWLSLDEAVAILDATKGTSRTMVHCELRLFMRRVEVKRLTCKDVYEGVLDVRGKGHGKGKWRTLAFAPETYQVFAEWMDERERMIDAAREYDPKVAVPEEFFIYRRFGHLYPYGDSGIDRRIQESGELANITRPVSNHMLRRTGARLAIEADDKNMAVLVEALGHTSEAQTRRYSRMTVDKMSAMHLTISDLLDSARVRMKQTGTQPLPPSMRIMR